MDKKIAGVVLAGGQSSRMGQDKALLDYNGKPLVEHMINVLKSSGLKDVYVSGNLKGYWCIPDSTPHEGPAYAIYDILQQFHDYDGVLFVPVDMPRLNAEALQFLMMHEQGAYFNAFPLPVFITGPYPDAKAQSVKELLEAIEVGSITMPEQFEGCMANTNTPEEWQGLLSA